MNSTVQEAKALLRVRQQLMAKSMTCDQRSLWSEVIVERLTALPAWQSAHRILLYAPLRDEPDIASHIRLDDFPNKEFFLPRFHADSGGYVATEFNGNWLELLQGTFGIREPKLESPELPLKHLDLIVVPGLVFDSQGHRLGRGKGFYDQLLAQTRGVKCGVAFEHQVMSDIPMEPHDIQMDILISSVRGNNFIQPIKTI